MQTSYQIIWTDEALRNLQSILNYLAGKWSSREVDQFLEKLEEREKILSQQPRAFPLSKKGGGNRRSVLTRQITIYYKFEDNVVKIRSVFDTRQDPDSLNLAE